MAENENNDNKKENMSKEEEIGFHKGSLSTLSKERAELLKMVSVVGQLMQMHVKALNDLGVDLLKDKGIKDQNKEKSKQKDKYKKPIEDLI
jgi:hypothetical protein